MEINYGSSLVFLMLSNVKSAAALVLFWTAFSATVAKAQTPQQSPQQKRSGAASVPGKQTFASTCAGCHGLDGRGGERAPNIAENSKVQRLSDAEIGSIIENGIPGAGMPAFGSLGGSQIKAVISYLRTLQGTNHLAKLPGDADRGEVLFFGKGHCSGCHMVAGKGGFIASDLSGYAGSHGLDQTRSAITSPALSGNRSVRTAIVTTRDREKYVGRIRNEDNFSLQLETFDGAFHFLSKSDVQTLEFSSQPLMPTQYGSILSSNELNDLLSFLMNTANRNGAGTPAKPNEEDQ
ncbi:MAG: c-type cytochrome [Candidatus Sulfotelmatobacter sp.]